MFIPNYICFLLATWPYRKREVIRGATLDDRFSLPPHLLSFLLSALAIRHTIARIQHKPATQLFTQRFQSSYVHVPNVIYLGTSFHATSSTSSWSFLMCTVNFHVIFEEGCASCMHSASYSRQKRTYHVDSPRESETSPLHTIYRGKVIHSARALAKKRDSELVCSHDFTLDPIHRNEHNKGRLPS